MHSRRMLSLGSLLAMLTVMSGCASSPVSTAECPRFAPSPEALEMPKTPDWEALMRRLPRVRQQTP